MSEPRTAGVRREDRLAAGMNTAGIVRAVRQETDSTYRVYVREWVLDSRHVNLASADDRFKAKYEGRVRSEDVRVVEDNEGGVQTWELQLRLWNVTAHWKHEWQALEWVELVKKERQLPDEDVRVVVRNSRSEHALVAYGKLLLPGGK